MIRYAFGRESWKLFNEVHEFDVDQLRWNLVPVVNSGPSVSSHAACLSGDRMIVFGGLNLAENRTPISSDELWVFDLKTRSWTQIPSPATRPCARFGHSLVPIDEYLFLLLGGCNGQEMFLNDVWLLKLMAGVAMWTPIIVRQSDAIPFQPQIHLNPVCKVSKEKLMILNFKQKMQPCFRSHTKVSTGLKGVRSSRSDVCLYFMDISRVKQGFVLWKKSLNRRIPGPDNVLFYTLHLTRNEIILFGGMEPVDAPAADEDCPRVSNRICLLSSRRRVT